MVYSILGESNIRAFGTQLKDIQRRCRIMPQKGASLSGRRDAHHLPRDPPSLRQKLQNLVFSPGAEPKKNSGLWMFFV